MAMWKFLALILIGVTAFTSIWFAWTTTVKLRRFQETSTIELKAFNDSVTRDISSLKDRLAQEEKIKSDSASDLHVITDKLKLTQLELRKARAEATSLNEMTIQKITALDTSVKTELATKLNSDDLNKLDNKIGAVRTDLDTLREDQKMAQSELGTLSAINHDDIAELNKSRFPWPPPQFTERVTLPDGLVIKNQPETLDVVFNRIKGALRHAKISDWALYTVGADGFLVVCRMETINDKGVAWPEPQRWSIDPVPSDVWSPGIYLRALFLAPPGRYRVIVLVVTSELYTATDVKVDANTLDLYLKMGTTDLPADRKSQMIASSARCDALIYEFQKQKKSDDPTFVKHSKVKTVRHLSGAMLWSLDELE